ncbi:beta-N-acetylhexosaminidase [Erwinia sp. S38]|uniref:beta-N-acetylhexosaminidase n=1 Tax=Erwinia sp. S38 TaxID=2769338 RepID=UPI00190BCE5F|nr:beta-N-acetylhexosaminidase [Erwinia sp. S38]MBK0003861.1 carbohydate-binding domain-containing protein [Erwinia sp. S38]
MRFIATTIAVATLGLAGCSHGVNDQQTVHRISQFGVSYQVTQNDAAAHGVDCALLGADWAACNRATIRLTNPGPAVNSKNWAIWMSNVHQTIKVDSDQFRIVHIVGDLSRLEPTSKFKGFAAGESVEIPIINEYWQLFITDIMPRWYVTAGKAEPEIMVSTNTEDLTTFVEPFGDNWKRFAGDKNVLMTAESRFAKNADVSLLPAAALQAEIFPTPLKVSRLNGNADLSRGVLLNLSGLNTDEARAAEQRFALMGIKVNSRGYPVSTRIDSRGFSDSMAVSGAYRLEVLPGGATIVGYDSAGIYYGLMSVLSLVPASGPQTITALRVEDAPRFAYRGMFLDVARNFHSKQVVLRLLDQMAAMKMNKFHFHLSDDEGWRIEIPGLPELTETGAKRCHDLTEQQCLLPQLGSGPFSDNNGSGYFTRADYIEILKYASARNIEVIPEIDMPAHARAAVISMEARYQRLMREGKPDEAGEYRLRDPSDTSNTTSVQFYNRTSYLNPCLDSSLRFADKVITEVDLMHQQAGVPLTTWHFGGDEAKNIYFGAGYTDIRHPEAGKGIKDMSHEDKPWAKSKVCQRIIKEGKVEDLSHLPSYFGLKVSRIVAEKGIGDMQAWQDGLKDAKTASDFATQHVRVNFWDTLFWGGASSVNDWANKGYQVVISNPDYVYLDFPAEVNPLERGYYWGTRYNDERKVFSFAPDNLPQNAETSVDRDGNTFDTKSEQPWPGAYGLSAQLWSETVRTDGQVESMIFPRVLAVAERSWHRAAWEQDYQQGREYQGGKTHQVDQRALHRDWQRFANLLGQRELARLDKAGIAWRLPQPGAVIVDSYLQANTALPGILVEYSIDEGRSWQRYSDSHRPLINGEVWVRTSSTDGKRFSRTEHVMPL